MKKYLVFIAISFCCIKTQSANIPFSPSAVPTLTNPVNSLHYFSTLSMKEVQQPAGRKLKLKEKIAVKIFQWKIKKGFDPAKKAEKKDKGKAALILGIIGIASLFIPYLILISIPCTVLALVLGYQAKKANPDDSKTKAAIILGWVTVGLYVLIIGLVIAFLLTWSGCGWG